MLEGIPKEPFKNVLKLSRDIQVGYVNKFLKSIRKKENPKEGKCATDLNTPT